MRNILHLWISMLVLTFVLSCEREYFSPIEDDLATVTENSQDKAGKATGEVLVILETPEGGEHGMGGPDMGNRPEGERNALMTFDAHEASVTKPAKGNIILSIYRSGEVKREISAEVYDVVCDENEAYFVAEVTYDSKPCTGSPGGPGGGGGCSGGHDEGGCSGHDSGTDGHDEGGCSGHDTGGDDHGGGGSGEHPGPSGKNCRIGQFIAVHVYDGGTPGTSGDEISWKWYGKKRNFPLVAEVGEWDSFCTKSIIEGNIVVH